MLRDIMLSIKYNKAQMFVGVKQGAGSNADNIQLLTMSSLRREIQKWIVANWGLKIIIAYLTTYDY